MASFLLEYPSSGRAALRLTTTVCLCISITFSIFLGVMVATKIGCTPSIQHGLAVSLLVFLPLTLINRIAQMVAAKLIRCNHPSFENALSAQLVKAIQWVVVVLAGASYAFGIALAALVMLSKCATHEKRMLGLTTLLFLGVTLVSGLSAIFLGRTKKTDAGAGA